MKRIKEKISENDMWVDGKFMSEKDMKDDGYTEHPVLTYFKWLNSPVNSS